MSTFEVINPRTGEPVAVYPHHSATDVAAAVGRARSASTWWQALSARERTRRLLRWKAVLARRAEQLADLIHTEMGKPHTDARLEVALAIAHIDWAARHAHRVLRRRSVWPGLLMANHAATVDYRPLGVVGVIGPWNYPAYTMVGTAAYALAAGNAVVLKPSEHTTGTGAWLVDAFAPITPEGPVLQLITGAADTGAALCRSGVDKIAFTGSTATGKRVMAACAETLTPVLLECGGNDAMLVDADADLDAAADAALWGSMSNAGQLCAGVERIYVHERVYQPFLSRLLERAAAVRAGTDAQAAIGPLALPAQAQIVSSHISDALARGAHAVLGGPDAVHGQLAQPTILTDVPQGAAAVTEETFGPVVTVAKVPDMHHALALANATRYGLAATVFARADAQRLAGRLRVGAVSVNSVLTYGAIPALPFGGIGDSGFGRAHGAEGLREFSRTTATTRQRFRPPRNFATFRRTPSTDAAIARLVTLLHGRS